MARMVVVFDLGLGQRGLFDRRPHHGLRPLIQAPVHQQLHELARDHRLGVVVHGEVRVVPLAGDAKAAELVALDADPVFGEAAAFLPELDDVHGVLVQPPLAVLLFDLPFDRQAVAVPAGDIARVAAHHLLAADDEVLEHLVQRVADMQMPVRVRRPVVQDERRAPGRGAAQAVVDAKAFPAGKPVRLTLRQARAHGEIRLRQENGLAIVGGLGLQGGLHVGRVGAHRGGSLEYLGAGIIPAARNLTLPGG